MRAIGLNHFDGGAPSVIRKGALPAYRPHPLGVQYNNMRESCAMSERDATTTCVAYTGCPPTCFRNSRLSDAGEPTGLEREAR